MLARANRITLGRDYKSVVRRGVRSVGPHTVTYVRRASSGTSSDTPVRFGFIVAKNVGKAHDRNTVRRRLKAVGHEVIGSVPPGTEIVIRALPGSESVAWSDLLTEVGTALTATSRR